MTPSTVELESAYDINGMYPVFLGEVFGPSNRYSILHKPGHSDTSTVWLAKDTFVESHTYVAVRIIAAHASTHNYAEPAVKEHLTRCPISAERATTLCLYTDKLTIKGVNGDHLCLTYPLQGPKLTLGVFGPADPGSVLRRACFDFITAVNVLHTNDVIHGSKF
jgi:hypothetical protein